MRVHNSINNRSLLFVKDDFLKNKNLTSNNLKTNNFMLNVKQLKMNEFIKYIWQLIISTSNATLEIPSLRSWVLFLLFLLFSKDWDLRSALWRYSLCFFFLLFSWSSMFIFEGLWLIKFTSLNLTSKFSDLPVLQTGWESEVLNVHNQIPYFSLYINFITLLGIIVEKLINNFIFRATFCFQKFSFFFKCGSCSFILYKFTYTIFYISY